MTSQGKTGVKRWMLGSVAQKVARHSPIPVLVLHETGATPVGTRRDSSPVRALVTLDGSVLAKTALEPAAQLIAALSTPVPGALHLLRVVKPLTFDEKKVDAEYILSAQEQGMHKAKTYMQSVVKHSTPKGRIGKLDLTITWRRASDDVADTIMKAAELGEDGVSGGIPGRCDNIAMVNRTGERSTNTGYWGSPNVF